ncbi:MAG: hypothetical protein ACE5IM_12500 [Nitrospinota bacterium]
MEVFREMFAIMYAQFLVGGVGLLALVPFRVLGRGFFKTCAWIFVILAFLHWWVAPRPEAYGGLSSLFGGSLWSTWEGREFGGMRIFALLTVAYLIALYRWRDGVVKAVLGGVAGVGTLSILSAAAAAQVSGMTALQAGLLPWNFILSALVLGTVFTGMLLGHYYLVKPDLPLGPLWRFAGLLLGALLAQGASLLAVVLRDFGPQQMAVILGENVFLTPWGLEFWGRVLVGLLGTFLVGVVIVISLRMHATRTVTGFFYIGILTVLVGELMSRNLFRLTHLPL